MARSVCQRHHGRSLLFARIRARDSKIRELQDIDFLRQVSRGNQLGARANRTRRVQCGHPTAGFEFLEHHVWPTSSRTHTTVLYMQVGHSRSSPVITYNPAFLDRSVSQSCRCYFLED
ncbi:hypothetical protein FKM82_027766 [Ascaphus truei]